MQDEQNAKLAHLQNAQIIVDSPAPVGTLRQYLTDHYAKVITLEVGNPNRFQRGLIRSSLPGISNVLVSLNMIDGDIEPPVKPAYLCSHSYWQYTDEGGFLEVYPEVTELIKRGQVIATLRNVFGEKIKEYAALEDGVVIGKSTHPVAQSGSRILHLGILGAIE
jgi:predicted deacylase